MEEQKYVYVILEDWQRKSGEKGIETTIFSTYEKAKSYYKKLKINYKEDYNDNDTLVYDEIIRDEKEFFNLEGTDKFSNDYFSITCIKRIIDNKEVL